MASVGDLVANLSLNSQDFTKGTQKARASLGSLGSSIGSFGAGMSGMLAPIAGAIAGVWGATESVGAYKEAITNQRKLSAVIEATGGAAGLTTEQITDFAAEMQQLTNFEDDATTGAAAALAAFTNIRGDIFTGTIEAAMDLSTVMGVDLDSAVKILGKSLNDPVEGLAKLAKAGVKFTDQQEKQIATMQQAGNLAGAQDAILSALEDRFGGAAQAVADPWKQLSNTMGDVAENIGSLLLPTINVVNRTITSMLGPIVDSGDAFKDFGIEAAAIFATVGEIVGTAASTLMSSMSTAITFVGDLFASFFGFIGVGGTTFDEFIVEVTVVMSHMGELISIAIDQWSLFFVQIGASVAHFFTEVIPAYLNWFAENWQNIFVTASSNVLTTFENLGSNIRSAWTAVLNFFRTGTFQFNWKPLTDGFINTVGKLPDIAPRVVTDLEKGLEASIGAATENLATSMTDQRKELMEGIASTRENLNKEFDTNSKVPEGVVAPEADASHDKKQTSNSAALAGSAEAAKIALSGLSGDKTMEDIARAQLAVEKEMLAEAKKPKQGPSEGSDIPG